MKTLLIVVVLVLIAWSVWGYLSSNVEQARYTVLRKADGYEVRDYPAHIVAQTVVQGSYDQALNAGFRIIAGYIFGGNAKKTGIAMTAPVTEQSAASEKIAMTAPVLATTGGDSHVISFGMPSSYTLATLPTPNDSRISLVEVPDMKMAVLRFSWFRTDARVKSKEAALLTALLRDKVQVVGTPTYAGYNAPWTPPWMSRNEVLVQIQ